MSYQGRSPIKDVVRSVVMGAAMVSPALLEACGGSPPTPPVPPDGNGNTLNVAGGADAGAPPNEVVRPRGPTGGSMPTRGFSGAARARG
jgi:hypothetical protein